MAVDLLAGGDDALVDDVVLDDVDAVGAGDGLDGAAGTSSAGAASGWRTSAVANSPGFSRPSPLPAMASTVSARWSERSDGEMNLTVAANSSPG